MNTAEKMTRIQVNGDRTNPSNGYVSWSPVNSLWMMLMYLGAIIGGVLTFSWSALIIFGMTSESGILKEREFRAITSGPMA